MASTTYVHDLATGYRRELRPDDLLASGLEVSAARVRVVGHHLGHAVSAAGCSGFDSAAVLVVDGGGSIVAWDDAGNPSAFERTSIYRWDGRGAETWGEAPARHWTTATPSATSTRWSRHFSGSVRGTKEK